MIIVFEKEYLRDLYVSGKSSDKKHRFQPSVVNGYKKAIDYMIRAQRREDLYLFRSLHFEALHGDKSGLYSVRADVQYRIEFQLEETDGQQRLTVANIVELSNHYK